MEWSKGAGKGLRNVGVAAKAGDYVRSSRCVQFNARRRRRKAWLEEYRRWLDGDAAVVVLRCFEFL